MTVLIIEGCDASGKSTLIEALRKELKEFLVRKGSSFEHSNCTNEELFKKFDRLVMASEYELTGEVSTDCSMPAKIIFDRFIYSNYVYASLYEDYAILTVNQRKDIEFWINHEAVILYLTAPEEILKERLNSRGDDYVKAERIPAILEKYDEVLATVDERIPVYRIDTSVQTTEDNVKFVINSLLDENGDRKEDLK